MFSKIVVLFLLILLAYHHQSFASIGKTREIMAKGYPFATIPLIKEDFVNGSANSGEYSRLIDQVVSLTGIKVFEVLDEKLISQTQAPSLKYLLAKKYLKDDRVAESIQLAKSIDSSHSFYPFAQHLLATAYSKLGQHAQAMNAFEDCIRFSKKSLNSIKDEIGQKQLEINQDYCTTGLARNTYAQKNFKAADLAYLDLPKNSPVWPDILLEEAWASFYQKNFNRTLGKLVTYKAPVFESRLMTEADVLSALTYLEMCLYDDAKKIADRYYAQMMNPVRSLRALLLEKGKKYDYYFKLMASYEESKGDDNDFMRRLLGGIYREPAYQEIRARLFDANLEYRRAKGNGNSRDAQVLRSLSADSLSTLKKILGSYVRSRMVKKYADFYQGFVDMSYIKLEILSRKKEKLYNLNASNEQGKRGDIKYLDRNDKQYFWDFKGEFWADELGDYVFALANEC
jgi:hypothetical protein